VFPEKELRTEENYNPDLKVNRTDIISGPDPLP
jgi:hypothetical protein